MEDHGRLIGVPVDDLEKDIEKDGNKQKPGDRDTYLRRGSQLRELLGQWSRKVLEKTHDRDNRQFLVCFEEWGEKSRWGEREVVVVAN